jgi:glycosyltransferase involved in cell wall biosynthesis
VLTQCRPPHPSEFAALSNPKPLSTSSSTASWTRLSLRGTRRLSIGGRQKSLYDEDAPTRGGATTNDARTSAIDRLWHTYRGLRRRRDGGAASRRRMRAWSAALAMSSRGSAVTPAHQRRLRPRPRPPVSFIAWAEDDGRAIEIAAALGGEARIFYDLSIHRRELVPLRYAISATRTIAYLLWRRPRSLIATNPPIFPALIGLAYARLLRVPMVLDSHPAAFGRRGIHAFEPLHAWVARRAESTLVTVEELAQVVDRWGSRADIAHEAPPAWSVPPPGPLPERPRILYIGRFAGDEPTAEVIVAAALAPELDFCITGDVRKCPRSLVAEAPPNVTFTGFLRDEAYSDEIGRANIVLVLTKRADAVNRAAYEAVYARRPLVVSASAVMRLLFPHAIHVRNDPRAIAAGLRSAVRGYESLVAATPAALAEQEARWLQQLSVLRVRLRLTPQMHERPLPAHMEHTYNG